ncbi:MAG: preprotein translocase subunit SecG [Planctomycetota bacterium]|nr:MAG: preprotein translocase subunit SecG [Planctomycetota bacterium]
MDLLILGLYVVFVLSAIVLVVVVLIQEGRGGGLTDALGTGGQATFGAGAKGINTFTGIVAGVFLASAIGITMMNRSASSRSVLGDGAAPAPLEIPGLNAPAPAPADGAPAAPAGDPGSGGGGAGAPQTPDNGTPPPAGG